jgi:hypothetical protein
MRGPDHGRPARVQLAVWPASTARAQHHAVCPLLTASQRPGALVNAHCTDSLRPAGKLLRIASIFNCWLPSVSVDNDATLFCSLSRGHVFSRAFPRDSPSLPAPMLSDDQHAGVPHYDAAATQREVQAASLFGPELLGGPTFTRRGLSSGRK